MEQITRAELLNRAAALVSSEREHDYGPPKESFARIANLWTAYLGHEIHPHEVGIMMALLKIARLSHTPEHVDSWADAAGYIATGAEVATGATGITAINTFLCPSCVNCNEIHNGKAYCEPCEMIEYRALSRCDSYKPKQQGK